MTEILNIFLGRLSEKIENAKFCSAGGPFPSLKQFFRLENPLFSFLGAKTWKKVKISWNFHVFDFSQIGPLQKVKYFTKNWFWPSQNALKTSEKGYFSNFWGFFEISEPPQSRNWLFSFSKTISHRIYETNGKFPTQFYNHKRFGSALKYVWKVEF